MTHGPPARRQNGQPATTYGAGWVTTGWPPTCTRGLGAVGCAWPPWAQSTVAPSVQQEAGHQITSSAPLLTDTDAGLELDAGAAVADSSMPARVSTIFSGVATTGGDTSIVTPPAPGSVVDGQRHAVGLEHLRVRRAAGCAGTSPVPQKQPVQIG